MFYWLAETAAPQAQWAMDTTDFPVRLLTATEVAEAIALRRTRAGRAKALRQVQHWTERRLLKPVGAIKTGTGTGREYSDLPTLQIAAIFQELVLLNFRIDQLRPISRHLYGEEKSPELGCIGFARAYRSLRSQLVLGFDLDPKGQPMLPKVLLRDANEPAPAIKCRSVLVLSLGPIWQRIKWPA